VRLRHRDGTLVHLSYGTNVLPAQDVDGIIAQVTGFGGGVRAALGADTVGLGLWLPADAARSLAGSPAEVERLRDALARQGIEVVTLNCFPYAGFHDRVVKKRVYSPDWSEESRLRYTLDAASVLARLLPDDVERGSISSLPLGWRAPWFADRQAAAGAHLAELAEGLAKLHADTGRVLRVGLEPEPGCVVETSQDAVDRLADVDAEWVGVCLDLCHLAVGFEEAGTAVARIGAAGLPVVKVQPAAAVHAERPDESETRRALESFSEDRFLHQVRRRGRTRVQGRDDLPDALGGTTGSERPLSTGSPWRVHYHVPVHAELEQPLRSTRDELRGSLRTLLGGERAVVDHLEVETYTWSVLPAHLRPAGDEGLVRGLAAELAWVRDALVDVGMEAA
jgi:sugar phosphate isomerase/epimerase